jgi:hypothetical protein
MNGSDHCPSCGCEQYEATCNAKADPTTCDCGRCTEAREWFARFPQYDAKEEAR